MCNLNKKKNIYNLLPNDNVIQVLKMILDQLTAFFTADDDFFACRFDYFKNRSLYIVAFRKDPTKFGHNLSDYLNARMTYR